MPSHYAFDPGDFGGGFRSSSGSTSSNINWGFDQTLQKYFQQNPGAKAAFLRYLGALNPEQIAKIRNIMGGTVIKSGKQKFDRFMQVGNRVGPEYLAPLQDFYNWYNSGAGRAPGSISFQKDVTLSAAQRTYLTNLLGTLDKQQLNRLVSGGRIGKNDLARIFKSGIRDGWLDSESAESFWDLLGDNGLHGHQNLKSMYDRWRSGGGGGGDGTDDGIDDGTDDDYVPPPRDDFDIPPWDQEMYDAIKAEILDAFENPGFPKEILQGMKLDQRSEFASALQHSMRGAQERLAERGITDSGQAERSFRDIETTNREGLASSLAGIDMENARASLQRIATAISGALGIRGLDISAWDSQNKALLEAMGQDLARELGLKELDIRRFAIEVDKLLGMMNIDLARELGLGDLDLRRYIAENSYLFQILPWLQNLLFPTYNQDTGTTDTGERPFPGDKRPGEVFGARTASNAAVDTGIENLLFNPQNIPNLPSASLDPTIGTQLFAGPLGASSGRSGVFGRPSAGIPEAGPSSGNAFGISQGSRMLGGTNPGGTRWPSGPRRNPSIWDLFGIGG